MENNNMSKKSKETIIHNIASRYLLEDNNLNIEITGNENKIKVLQEALESSKLVYDILKNKNYTNTELNEAIERKNIAAENIKKTFDIDWML
jgi:hypothetical protein